MHTNEQALRRTKNMLLKCIPNLLIVISGNLLYDTPYCRYNLTMLDTIYVRQHFRHQGFGTQLIRHFLAGHSEEDVGFSAPLSHNLLAGEVCLQMSLIVC